MPETTTVISAFPHHRERREAEFTVLSEYESCCIEDRRSNVNTTVMIFRM